ncbi:hypothetical protein LINGRAHAP2_LOCUS4676 [Linum grandiflorum]
MCTRSWIKDDLMKGNYYRLFFTVLYLQFLCFCEIWLSALLVLIMQMLERTKLRFG